MAEKRITRWKSGGEQQKAAYLQEMAEQGLLLEEMGYYKYTFREGEPQYLQYRIEERECVPTEEERAAYVAEGWQEICHYETEYIFARERDPFREEPSVMPQEAAAKLEQEIEEKKVSDRREFWWNAIYVVFFGCLCLAMKNTSALRGLLFPLVPFLLLSVWLNRRNVKKMQQKKERMLEGDLPQETIDWRRSRNMTILLVVGLVVSLSVWVFYTSGFNEKTFDLPKEISYAEIPAVRLEMLTEEPLTRMGESVDPSMEGFRLNADFGKGIAYDVGKKWGSFANYGIDHKYLLRTEKQLETKQCMQTADGTKWEMDTMYYRFRKEKDAKAQCNDQLEQEKEREQFRQEQEIASTIPMDAGEFDLLHICCSEWAEGTSYHILCRQGKQVMELDGYAWNGEVEDLLKEISAVFAAQEI